MKATILKVGLLLCQNAIGSHFGRKTFIFDLTIPKKELQYFNRKAVADYPFHCLQRCKF